MVEKRVLNHGNEKKTKCSQAPPLSRDSSPRRMATMTNQSEPNEASTLFSLFTFPPLCLLSASAKSVMKQSQFTPSQTPLKKKQQKVRKSVERVLIRLT